MKRMLTRIGFFSCMMMSFVVIGPQNARANNCCNCPLQVAIESEIQWEQGSTAGSPSTWPTVPRLVNHVVSELAAQRIWMISVFWEDNVLPSLMLMSEQLSAVAMKQTQIVGSFFDARQQMETQQVIQTIHAQAHKDYHPSVGVCEFGSVMKSLAATERKGEFTAFALAQRSMDRQLGNATSAGRTGQPSDKEARIAQFRTDYCDPKDNNNGLGALCGNGGEDARLNKDIDFVRTLAYPDTLDVDFSNEDLTKDEEDVIALASNLYGNELFSRINASALAQVRAANTSESQNTYVSEAQKNYMEMRSLIAKRNVAENSYNAIVGMKAQGATDADGLTQAQPYLKGILKEMGISEDDAQKMIGDNPSYYAQMEILSKTMFQDPNFYTHLYDKPVNVERKQVALQAIGLMQKFDLFKSYLRNEASLSVLLELAVMDLQSEIENEGSNVGASGERPNN